MNALDLAIVAIVVAGAGVGYLQGIIRQVTNLFAVYLSTVLAIQFHTKVGEWLGFLFVSTELAPRASVGLVLVFFWSVLFLGWTMRRIYPATRIVSFGIADNVLGGVLGLLGGAALVCVLTTGMRFALTVPWPSHEASRAAVDAAAQASLLLPIVGAYTPALYATLTPWFPSGVPAIIAT